MTFARLRSIEPDNNDGVTISRSPGSPHVRINGVTVWASNLFDVLNVMAQGDYTRGLQERDDRIADLEEVIEDIERLLADADQREVDRIHTDRLRAVLDQRAPFTLPTALGSVVKAARKGNPFGPARREFHLLSNGNWLNWADKEYWSPDDLIAKWTDFEVLAGAEA